MVINAEDYKNGVGVDPVEKYIKALDTKAARTKELYLRHFNDFINWTVNHPNLGYDAERLLEIHRDFLVNHPDKADYIPDIVKEWIAMEADKRGWKKATTMNPRKAIKLFFKVNNAPINLTIDKVPNEGGVDPMWIGDLRDLMDNRRGTLGDIPLRNKALIMVLKDTGLRVSDLMVWLDKDDRKMRGFYIETFLDAERYNNEAGEEFRYIPKYKTKKEGVYAHVHMGPEAIEAIRDYLGARDSGPVFLSRDGEPMRRVTITNTVRRCLSEFKRNYSAHSLRKMHDTRLSAKIKDNEVLILQGKSLDGSKGTYFKPYDTSSHMSELTRHYIDAYNEIRVKETGAKAMIDIQKRLQDAEAQVAELHAWKDATGVYKRVGEDLREAYLAVLQDPSLIPPIRKRMKMEPEDEEAEGGARPSRDEG